MSEPIKILILAGEVSGDMHAAALIQALRELSPRPIDFRGMGGDAMAAQGTQLLYHTDQLGAMGLAEILANARFFKRAIKTIIDLGITWQPDLLITIDYAGFNMRVAKALHTHGIKTVHYISPKVWVWRRRRIYSIAKAIDLMLCIFPFEPAYYAPTTLKALFVGNPLTERADQTWSEPSPALPWSAPTHIALLPGSRRNEIRKLLPIMLDAAILLDTQRPQGCSFIIPVPTAAMRAEVQAILDTHPQPTHLAIIDGNARHVMRQSRAAIVASGTATLEACLMKCPTILTYRMHPITAWLCKHLLKGIQFVGLANIVAQRSVMPELLQDALTPEAIIAHILPLIDDTPQRTQTLADFQSVIDTLGHTPASHRAAQAILAKAVESASRPL